MGTALFLSPVWTCIGNPSGFLFRTLENTLVTLPDICLVPHKRLAEWGLHYFCLPCEHASGLPLVVLIAVWRKRWCLYHALDASHIDEYGMLTAVFLSSVWTFIRSLYGCPSRTVQIRPYIVLLFFFLLVRSQILCKSRLTFTNDARQNSMLNTKLN